MSPLDRIQISQIGQIAIPVQDLARAVPFYRDVLGLPFLFEIPSLAFFQCGEVRLMLSIPERPEATHAASILYYQVDDLPQVYSFLREHGAKLLQEPHFLAKMADHDLWMAFIEDTEGNTLGLMSEVRTP